MLVLVDTGASADFIDEDLIKEIDPIIYELKRLGSKQGMGLLNAQDKQL